MGPQPPQQPGRATVMPEGTCPPPADEPKAAHAKAAAGAAEDPAAAGANGKQNPAAEAFARIKCDVEELKEYASYYLAAKVDGFKQSIRNLGLYAALGILGAVVGGAMVATAAGMIVVGIGQGLGALFGGRYWLGYLVTGIVIVGAVGVAAWMMMNKLTGAWRSSTLKKYEQRKQTQRIRFGHTVGDRAATTGHRDLTAAAAGGAVADGSSSAKGGGPGGQKGD